jgi:hypothetical protein
MNSAIFLAAVFSVFFVVEGKAQGASWRFLALLEKENYFLLQGEIDGKYPITMQLWEQNYARCGASHFPIQFRNGALDGWYSYDKIGKKIPLVGYYKHDHCVRLYVPENLLDTLDRYTCEPPGSKEIFTNDEDYDLTRMQWKQRVESEYKGVELEILHAASQETKAFLALRISEIEMARVNISERSGIFSIDEILVLSAAHQEDGFHVLFEVNDWGWREAQEYVGYLWIDEDLEVRGFSFVKTYDSWFGETQDEIHFDLKFPHRGITIQKH